MDHDNFFIKPDEYYQREINPLAQYVEQSSVYLSKMSGKSIDVAREWIRNSIKNKRFENAKDPVVRFFERQDNGDRIVTESRLSKYINQTVAEGDILAPTFTTYLPTSKKQSLLVEFVDTNVARRSASKKEAFKAKALGKMALYVIKNNDQTNMKLFNNAMSGAFASSGTVISNPTAHSTLTTITRTVSSLGNASNEKIIGGNRHYRTSKIALDNLVSVVATMDHAEFQHLMDTYNLNYPSVDDLIDCVKYSSDFYWKDAHQMQKIRDFAEKLEPLERAAFVYGGDFYHLRKHNEEFVRMFITELGAKVTGVKVENPIEVLSKADELLVNFVHQICIEECRGIGKDYTKLSEENQNIVAATSLHVFEVTKKYQDFIAAIFLTRNVPATTAYIPDMVRRSVVLSDTDSTMFSVDEWVMWYFGKLDFSAKGFAVAGTIAYIATQSIAHILALFSANLGVERKKLHKLAMKPEFVFPVFCQSSVAKHYFTCIAMKEGNVYSELEMEIKGVHLKNSANPQELVKDSHKKMREIVETVMAGKKISLLGELHRVSEIEKKIDNSIETGNVIYYKGSKIKEAEGYSKGPDQSPYQHHNFWESVFGTAYNFVDTPPYAVIKVPTTLANKTAVKNWIDSIEDKALADRLLAWMVSHNKTALNTIYLSKTYVSSFGIPKEIVPIINYKKIVLDLTTADRMILETLGFFPKHNMLIEEEGY